jgi:hypothetical protein
MDFLNQSNEGPFINRDERVVLKRKIFLKSQAIKIIGQERCELRQRLFLIDFKRSLEKRINNDFDQGLSAKLTAINFLLEAQG